MRKYIITKENGGFTLQHPIGDRFEYSCKSGGIGAEIKIWKTLKGAEDYVKKVINPSYDYEIEIK